MTSPNLLKRLQDEVTANFTALEQKRQSLIKPATQAVQPVPGYRPPENLSLVDWAKVVGAGAINTLIKIAPSVEKPSDRPQIRPSIEPTVATKAAASGAQRAAQEQQSFIVEVGRLNWRQQVLSIVPAGVSAGLYKSVPDILKALNNPNLDDTDIQFASQVLLEAQRQAQPLPPQYDQKARQELIAQLSRARSVSTYGIGVASQQDFLGRLTALQQPKLPEGMTNEQFAQVLREAAWTPEEIAEKASVESMVHEQERAWATYQARQDVLLSEFSSLELPEIEKRLQAEKLKVMTNPSLAGLFIPFEMWQKIIEPRTTGPAIHGAALAGTTLAKFLGLRDPGGEDFLNKLSIAKDMGLNNPDAYVYAVENWDTNGLVKFLALVVTDPINLLGFHVTSSILRPIPLIGHPLAGLNEGFIRATDSVAMAAKSGLQKIGGKTLDTATGLVTKSSVDGLIAAVSRLNGTKRIQDIPVGQVRDTLVDMAKYSLSRPSDTTEGAFGRALLMQKPVDLEVARGWTSRLGVEFDETAFVSDYRLVELDNLLNQTKGIGGAQIGGEVPNEQLLRILGADVTEANLKTAATIFEGLKSDIEKQITRLTAGESTQTILNKITANTREVVRATKLSEVGVQRAKWLSLTGWQVYVDSFAKQSVVHGFSELSRRSARWYLLFAMYSPLNILENGIKTAIAELNPFTKGNIILLGEREFAGLTGLPDSLKAVGFVQDIGPIDGMRDRAQRYVIVKRPEASVNAFRRALRDIPGNFSKFATEFPNEVFIRAGAQISSQQQMNFVVQASRRALQEANPEVVLGAMRVAQQYKGNLVRAGFTPKMAEQIVDESFHRAITDYNQLDSLHLDWTPDTVSAIKLVKMKSQYDSIGPYVQDFLSQRIQQGTLLSQMDEAFQIMREMKYQEILASPEIVGAKIQEMVSGIISNPAKSLEEFQAHIVTLNDIADTIAHTVDSQVVMGQHTGTEIINKIKKGEHFETLIEGRLIPFLQVSEDSIKQLVADMKSQLDVLQVSPAFNKKPYTDLLNKYLSHTALYIDARNRQFEVERLLKLEFKGNTPPIHSPRANDWWQEFYDKRNEVWDSVRVRLAQESADIENDAALLGGEILPTPFRTAAGGITPADVARLYGIRTQDVRPGLYRPEANLFMSKEAWVTRIYQRAKRVAGKGSETPEQLGFSRDKLSELYDSMLEELKSKEPIQNLAKPAFDQLDKFREDVELYATTRGAEFTPEMTQSLQEYGKAVKAGLESDPQLGILTSRETRDFVGEGELLELERWVKGPDTAERERLTQQVVRLGDEMNELRARMELPIGDMEKDTLQARYNELARQRLDLQEKAELIRDLSPEQRAENELAEIAQKYSSLDPLAEALNKQALDVDTQIESARANRRILEHDFGIGSPEAVSTDNKLNKLLDLRSEILRQMAQIPDTGIEAAVMNWFDHPSTESLQTLGDLVRANKPYQAEIHKLLRERYPTGYIRIYRGEGGARFPLNREYTNVTADRATAGQFESGYKVARWPINSPEYNELLRLKTEFDNLNLGESPETLKRGEELSARITRLESSAPEASTVQINDVVIKVEDVLAIASAKESELILDAEVLRDRIFHPIELPTLGQTQWNFERQKALDTAVKEYYLNFPDYDHTTALNSSIKALMPFWTYEAHRPFYLARTFIQKPLTYTTLGRYRDSTDQGYVHVPGTQNVQANLFRGTIWGMVSRQQMWQTNPDYYDQYPGVSNFVNTLQRFGFYFSPVFSTLTALAGAKRGTPQLGELLPPMLATPLEAFAATFPESNATPLMQLLMSNRFRDYYIAQMVSQQGGDGPALLDKMRLGVKLEPEEQQQWNSGTASVARFNLLSIQAGMLRLKPPERKQFQDLAKKTLAEATGVSVELQDKLAEAGLSLGDVIPISPEVRQLVNELEGASQWRGFATGLQPSEAGFVLQLTRQYYREIADKRDSAQVYKQSLDAQFKLPASNPDHIDRRTWESQTQALDQSVFEFGKQLKLSDSYKQALVTRKEREQFALDHNQPLLLQHPEDELLAEYFNLQPELKFDPEANVTQMDFEGFYKRRQLIIDSLEEPYRSQFIARIGRWDTPLEQLRRSDYDYMRPYFDAKNFVKSTLPVEFQKLIAQYEATSDPQVRASLRAELDKTTESGGLSIISQYESQLSNFRKRMRQLDPELDARLALWRGLTPVTAIADQTLTRLRQSYGLR